MVPKLSSNFGDLHIEVLITDVNMPGISGYQLVDGATEMRPELKVILVSGAASDPHGVATFAQAIPASRSEAGNVGRWWRVLTVPCSNCQKGQVHTCAALLPRQFTVSPSLLATADEVIEKR
jgi:CheY-like chemotaxis protein